VRARPTAGASHGVAGLVAKVAVHAPVHAGMDALLNEGALVGRAGGSRAVLCVDAARAAAELGQHVDAIALHVHLRGSSLSLLPHAIVLCRHLGQVSNNLTATADPINTGKRVVVHMNRTHAARHGAF